MYNYKLECATDETKSMSKLIESLDITQEEQIWHELLRKFKKIRTATLMIILITPVISGKATIVCTPAALITVMVIFIAILVPAWSTYD